MLVTVHRSLLVQFTFVDSVRAHRANYITLRAGAGMICNLNVILESRVSYIKIISALDEQWIKSKTM